MASYYPPTNKWKARVKREGIEYYLGYFPTKEEAEAEEKRFASRYPSMRGKMRNRYVYS